VGFEVTLNGQDSNLHSTSFAFSTDKKNQIQKQIPLRQPAAGWPGMVLSILQ